MTRSAGDGGLLRRHRDFRLLWCGETAGKFGASVTGVAMPLIAVSDLGAFQTAYTAYLPGLLEPADQAEGNAKLHGSASAAQIAGLGSGGLITQLAGAVNGMFVNAATFLVSLLCLAGIRHREPRPPRAGRRRGALAGEVGEGLRLVAGDPWLRTLTLFGAASNLALMGYQSIRVVFLVQSVGLAPGPVGALVAAAGAGGVAGAFAARRVAGRFGTARATLLFELGLAVFALLMPLTVGGAGVLLFVAGGFCVSAGVVGGNVIKAGFLQRYCPPELLARLTAPTAFVNYGTIPLGALLGGALGTVLGLRAAMWVTTAGIPLAALVLLFSPVGRARDLPASRRPTDDAGRTRASGGSRRARSGA
ncbi:MFS transporter [Streptomyces griseocarneus]|uniref:MFS transporter n=1 Tax=Streptomyces griseocarneus TaxID=51201 RepID=UPI00167D7ED9|nr:MFS transporter [Streptomyces griseocarneus]MBZ6477736.1 MFS transporter [Streptomyces griseocarneus]GHG61340.1 MFS transporter [Streptomyces griseocarneus]